MVATLRAQQGTRAAFATWRPDPDRPVGSTSGAEGAGHTEDSLLEQLGQDNFGDLLSDLPEVFWKKKVPSDIPESVPILIERIQTLAAAEARKLGGRIHVQELINMNKPLLRAIQDYTIKASQSRQRGYVARALKTAGGGVYVLWTAGRRETNPELVLLEGCQ